MIIREGGLLISKIKQLSDRVFDKKLKSYNIFDLNSAQGRIMFTLWKNDNISIKDLAKETALGKTSLTSMLSRLEKSKHIIKMNNPNDKRKTIVSLTEKSIELKNQFEEVSIDMTEIFYKGLNKTQIDEFESMLSHILNNLIECEMENK